jgi:hypothetical protein
VAAAVAAAVVHKTDENNTVPYLHSSPPPVHDLLMWGYIQWGFQYLFPFSNISGGFFKRLLPHFHFHHPR